MKEQILSSNALAFLTQLQRRFNHKRKQLLEERVKLQSRLSRDKKLILHKNEELHQDSSWSTAPPPSDLRQRWVEITGPTERKMMINALNSGADVFMADFEDANAPTWNNMLQGQANLQEAIRKTLTYQSPEGTHYKLNSQTSTIVVRARGLHLDEKHLSLDGEFCAASLFDFGLAIFHNAQTLITQGSGPYFYLPKLENSREATLWSQILFYAEELLNLTPGTIRVTVLIETLPAALEMEEILFALKEHICGLNAGRWDYLFSIIKTFAENSDLLFPDRAQLTMDLSFMRTYCERLVQIAHKRGAHAIGGMSAFIPSRKDPSINQAALAKVEEDKLREVAQGFDGTWVAHPDLVPIAHQIFARALQGELDQKSVGPKKTPALENLLKFQIPNSHITEAGFRHNIAVALLYLTSWLSGTGAVALHNLMEDAATAEICRAQLWQWIHHSATFSEGKPITSAFYTKVAEEEANQLSRTLPAISCEKLQLAKQLLDKLVLNKTFEPFLTLSAYNEL